MQTMMFPKCRYEFTDCTFYTAIGACRVLTDMPKSIICPFYKTVEEFKKGYESNK